jgi:hypothetical protein
MSKLNKKEAIRIMKMKKRPDPGKEFWDGYWDRLAARIEDEFPAQTAAAGVHSTERPGAAAPSRVFNRFPRWAFAAAAGLVILFTGVQIGRRIGPAPTDRSAGRTISRNPLLVGRITDYFTRSKVILLSLANFDPGAEDPYALNLAVQKQVSRELVDRGRELESLLTGAEGKRYKSLIADLKTILVQIANLDPEENAQAVEIVRNGLALKEILFKISISLMSLPAAEKPANAVL